MASPRVYSCLPRRFTGVLESAFEDEVEHVALGEGPIPRQSRQAVDDPAAVALIGPLLSTDVMYAMPICNLAGLAHLAPAATFLGLTREGPGVEEGLPGRLQPLDHRPTFLRLAVHDGVVAAAALAYARSQQWSRLALVHDDSDYGLGIAAQLVLHGLEPVEDPAQAHAILYAGTAGDAPVRELLELAPLPVLAFGGAGVAGFADAVGLDRVQLVLAQYPEEGWSEFQCFDFAPHVHAAGRALREVLARLESADRRDVLGGLWATGAFDRHGDTLDRRCGVWRDAGGGMFEGLGVLAAPAGA